MAEIVRIAPALIEGWTARLLKAVGVPDADAGEIAGHLLFADLRGVDTHGVSRLKLYLARLKTGAMSPVTQPTVLNQTPVSTLIDGGNGFGHVVGRQATDLCIAKAQASGVGVVTVRRSSHCGCLAYYTLLMARAGLIGVAATNVPATMAPFGGKAAYFGTNPFSIAVPAGHGEFVLDMATSQVARGKLTNAAREGKPIAEGWAITRDGLPTTDAKAGLDGFVLPLGGAKGSALAFMVEILCGVLPGALVGPELPQAYEEPDKPQGLGHFFLAFRPDLFMPLDAFTGRMDKVLADVRAIPPAPGFSSVLAPGDVESAREAENRRLGVPVTPGIRSELRELAAEYGVPLPAELA